MRDHRVAVLRHGRLVGVVSEWNLMPIAEKVMKKEAGGGMTISWPWIRGRLHSKPWICQSSRTWRRGPLCTQRLQAHFTPPVQIL